MRIGGSIIVGLMLGVAVPALADDLKPICPDRPGRGTSACTLEAGHAQVELGLYDESFQRRSGVTTDTGSAGALLGKVGINDSLDVEAGLSLYQFQRTHDASGTQTQSGIGDLLLRAKLSPMTASDGPLAVVLDPFIKLPTAGGGLGNGAVEGGLAVPMSYDLGGGWSLGATTEADILRDGSGGGYHANLVGVAGLNKALGDVTLGAELWTGQNIDPSGTVSQVSADADIAYLLNNDTQLDGGVNLGLNRATPDLELYFGISRRF